MGSFAEASVGVEFWMVSKLTPVEKNGEKIIEFLVAPRGFEPLFPA